MTARRGCWGMVFVALTALVPRGAGATVTEVGPADDLRPAIAALGPGDELVLRGGTYNLNYRFAITVTGADGAPIVIRAKAGETPIITRPDANQNTVNVEGSSYLVLRGLEITGGSIGLRIASTSFLTVEECHIHDTPEAALTANTPGATYDGLVIRRNHIHHAGGTAEGMYLGCNDSGCVVENSLIEGNYIHDLTGGTVTQGDGIELKMGSFNTVIRDNVIHDVAYPCILAYGTGGQPVNTIERNAMWNCGDMGIQVAADAVVRNNIIIHPAANGIHSQVHQQATPGNLTIVHNTIVMPGNAGIRVTPVAAGKAVVIANNAIYVQSGTAIELGGDLSQVTVAGNVGIGALVGWTGGFDAGGSITADFVDVDYGGAKWNVFPKAGSKLIGAGAVAFVAADDFNGTPRSGVADVGAYLYGAAGNPGWTVGPGFKDEVVPPAQTDAGVSDGPIPDGSTPTDGSGPTGDGGSHADGGGGDGGGGDGASGGCGCRSAAGGPSAVLAALALLALVGRTLRPWRRQRR